MTRAAYRKRLSRARAEVIAFTRRVCGLVEPSNGCRCHRRVAPAIRQGRVNPNALLHAHDAAAALAFPQVLSQIRALDALQRTVALYRSHPAPMPKRDFALDLRKMLDSSAQSDL
mgnify:CR=1 FL=1